MSAAIPGVARANSFSTSNPSITINTKATHHRNLGATMSARDKYHDPCKKALIKDGWKITDDPLRLEYGSKDMYVDLGAEEVLAAEKAGQKIAVEIKSFLGPSDLTDLQRALGQFVLYRSVIERTEP